ncbi:Uncharacterized protein FKW44_001266 [Caligus rogercresseyi]|uniref:Small acidic protein-like domain-containing protein n=1 Tax=Caligus rogercresseyi TaxID=217165 RepID=A0A7T8KIL3_CALRO|nr:Uncharacterized protein FKW44_001266 [Caligus rogercresseyi]
MKSFVALWGSRVELEEEQQQQQQQHHPLRPETNPLRAKQQKKMFKDLDQQYEKARITTHTARGLGLGFNNPLLHGGDDQYAKLPRK